RIERSTSFPAMKQYAGLGSPQFTEKDYPSFEGKVVIVTGASAGVGYEVVKLLSRSTKAKIYAFGRNPEKTLAAMKRLEIEVASEFNKTNLDIHYIEIDFSDLTTIKPAVEKFLEKETRLDLIIHNAAVMSPPLGTVTKQGYELQLGTNNIGPQLLQKLLDPLFIETSNKNNHGESRIVWVSSNASFSAPLGGIHLPDPNFRTTEALPWILYSQTKAINILQSKYWLKANPEATNVTSVSLSPGILKTELQRNITGLQSIILYFISHLPIYGAYTELFAAFSPVVKSGDYIESFGKIGSSRYDLDDLEYAKNAYEYLEEQIKDYL
ncbi:uncharacterized protein RJT21DRAFT_86278, partial [Scheffersomyces amazonensis]|uniref:uncharacterized protein n=1 Tax=Scheffersomyces amazonensis TaxID=1078765 RepID=UPI00315D277D